MGMTTARRRATTGRVLAAGAAVLLASAAPPPDGATPPAAVAAAPLPVEVFAALPTMESPSLSPDGTRIASKMAVAGNQYLVVRPLFGDAKPAIARLGGEVDVNWWSWVGSDWLAIGVGAEQKLAGEPIYITRMLGTNATMTRTNRLDWTRSGQIADTLLWHARDGSPRILFAKQVGIDTIEQTYPSVFEADLSTGRTHRIVGGQADVYNWYADSAGTVRMGWRYNDRSRKGTLLYRATADDSFKAIAVQRRNDEEGVLAPELFRADGGAIALDDADGHNAVYELSLPDLKRGKKLFGVDGYDVDDVIADATGADIAGVSYTGQGRRTEWLAPALREVQANLDKAVGVGNARIVSWNADRTRFLVALGGPSQAGGIYYFDVDDGRLQLVAWQNQAIKNRRLSPVSTIRYAARDGTPIEAVLTLPRSRPPKNLPLIVMPHGGPFARDAEDWDWWAQYLAESGYAVVQPNYRGSSGYGTAFAKLGEGQWGLKMQDDLDDVVGDLAKRGIADPKRVCMVGASYGGYAAMRAAQRGNGLYRCAVSYAGVSDLAELRRYDAKFLNGNGRGDWLKRQAPDFRAISPRYGAASFSIPILMVHGRMDRRVPVRQSQLMASALKDAGKPYDYVEQPLADHFFSRSEDRLDFLKRMKAFLDRYNPA